MVEETPTHTQAEKVTLRGVATHPRAVKDVVVWVQGHGGPLTDHKLGYKAQQATGKSDDAKPGELDFEFEIPLELGSNEISVIARDRDDVESRWDVAIHRE